MTEFIFTADTLQVFLASVILAQTSIDAGIAGIISIIQKLSIALFFIGLVHGAVSYAFGRPESIKFALIGAGFGVLAWTILEALQNAIGTNIGITLP